jgi:hypothetical protein
MKVKDFVAKLAACDPDDDIVIKVYFPKNVASCEMDSTETEPDLWEYKTAKKVVIMD